MFGELTPCFNALAPFIVLFLIMMIAGSIKRNLKQSYKERFGDNDNE